VGYGPARRARPLPRHRSRQPRRGTPPPARQRGDQRPLYASRRRSRPPLRL
ncbi:MAG: hypothetical protein AVDCRST_MAG55-2958, partial [uncultured Rubrobacteraceae bacterium]